MGVTTVAIFVVVPVRLTWCRAGYALDVHGCLGILDQFDAMSEIRGFAKARLGNPICSS
jgi:hypothetical protein